jgi:hypothetical protein
MDDYIPQPRPRLSDEAAAQVLDFLYDLVADFESAYAGQILRHRNVEAEQQRDLRQFTLFADPNGDPF